MELALIRHGIAEDPASASLEGRRDAERRLTAEGARRIKEFAQAFAQKIERVDLILHSPYRRAIETAEIFAVAFHGAIMEKEECLRPQDDPEVVADLLESHANKKRVLLVSHDPFLSFLASLLLTGSPNRAAISFQQGSVAGFEWGGPGASRLLYLLPPLPPVR